MTILPTFEQYCQSLETDYSPTYEQYVAAIEGRLDESLLGDLRDRATQAALNVLRPIREAVLKIAEDFKVGIGKVIEAFRIAMSLPFCEPLDLILGPWSGPLENLQA